MTQSPATQDREWWVQLDQFEGPLALLLHIIRKHELDILDIPVAFMLDRFLDYLAAMKDLQLDVAAEYLSMAATLVFIKSKMLLPGGDVSDEEAAEEGVDPRAELVRRLLEYAKYREASASLASRALLGQEIFTGGFEPDPGEREVIADLGLFDLVERVEELIREARSRGSVERDVQADRITVAERIGQVAELVARLGQVTFRGLLGQDFQVIDVIVTFLAVLEMARLKMIRVVQTDEEQDILVMQAPEWKGNEERTDG